MEEKFGLFCKNLRKEAKTLEKELNVTVVFKRAKLGKDGKVRVYYFILGVIEENIKQLNVFFKRFFTVKQMAGGFSLEYSTNLN